MHNKELLNCICAIKHIVDAYLALSADSTEPTELEQAVIQMLDILFEETPALTNAKSITNVQNDNGLLLGYCDIFSNIPANLSRFIQQNIPLLSQKNGIRIPLTLDITQAFSVALVSDNSDRSASVLAEYILASSLSKNPSMQFRCVDLLSGGSFFSSALPLITQFPLHSGGQVYTRPEMLSELLKDLESQSNAAMAKLGNRYHCVSDYNAASEDTIPEFIHIFHLDDCTFHRGEVSRLQVLIKNSHRNGMHFVITGSKNIQPLLDASQIQLTEIGKTWYLDPACTFPLTLLVQEADITSTLSQLEASMLHSDQVDTLYENHPELHTDFLTMDSTQALRIPYAIDRFNRVQYFELGGSAPPHALIAGSTGSGKSSVLHTLIMQTIHHYHPDDVEIWAIDYKAVEFNFYIQYPAPHFRVIAHDTATEFSLSLIDLLYQEYEARQQKFLDAKVKDIEAYRKKYGKRSMPRILVVIDEFQLLTQAVITYVGEKEYRTELENLLRLTRAMGISFVFSSQTIASGLQGLSHAARNQIGCRLCLKHVDDNEIRETLVLSGMSENAIVYQAKSLRRGQGIYKRTRWAGEHSPDGKGYEFLQSHILFLNEAIRCDMIAQVDQLVGDRYTPKETITVRGGGRIPVAEKVRHPFEKYIAGTYTPAQDYIEWYPAAPASLADHYMVPLEQAAGANILVLGEHDDLRDSVIFHSVCGFLLDPRTQVVVNIIDEEHSDRARILSLLRQIRSPRFQIWADTESVLQTILDLKKIRPSRHGNTVYLWYGLDKLKNAIFLLSQDGDPEEAPPTHEEPEKLIITIPDNVSFDEFLAKFDEEIENSQPFDEPLSTRKLAVDPSELDYGQCVSILKTAFDAGPENGHFHMAVFNNLKGMNRCKIIELSSFENILSSRISLDDSHDLFKSGLAVQNMADDAVVFSAGGSRFTTLRPYLLPDRDWIRRFSSALIKNDKEEI